jgi:hypothetical protein
MHAAAYLLWHWNPCTSYFMRAAETGQEKKKKKKMTTSDF